MQPLNVLFAGHEVRRAGLGGDVTVEALSELANHKILCELDRQINIEHVARGIAHVRRCLPRASAVNLQPHLVVGVRRDA